MYEAELKIPAILQQNHFPGLDGLRGISIIIVILAHISLGTPYDGYFDGGAAVEIFFVISGFLITGILLGCREKSADLSWSIYAFYARRFLRIFPPYYLVLALSALLIAGAAGRSLLAHVVYASNILFAIKGVWAAHSTTFGRSRSKNSFTSSGHSSSCSRLAASSGQLWWL